MSADPSLLLDRVYRAGLLSVDQMLARAGPALEQARAALAEEGLAVRLEPVGGERGARALACGLTDEQALVASVTAADNGRSLYLRVRATRNESGLAPSAEALAREDRRIQAKHTADLAAFAQRQADYERRKAEHPEALRRYQRELSRARDDWRAGALTRRAQLQSKRVLVIGGGLAAGAALLALTVLIVTRWDIGAYYDKIFHTWMVLLIIKLAAALLPVAVVLLPLALSVVLPLLAFRWASEQSGPPFVPPPEPRAPEPPRQVLSPEVAAGNPLRSPEQMAERFVSVVRRCVEEAFAPPDRRRRTAP